MDALGHVIGINSMIAGGLGLAVPSNDILAFLQSQEQRPLFGVTLQQVQLGAGKLGLLVLDVAPASAAEAAGLIVGDVLTGVHGTAFRPARGPRTGLAQDQDRRSVGAGSAAWRPTAPAHRAGYAARDGGGMIRVLVVAASAIMRAGLEAIIATAPALEVAGTSAGGATLRADVVATRPEVALIDLEWRRDDPLPELPDIGTEPGDPVAVFLTEHPEGAWLVGAIETGVHAVLPREATSEAIVAAVQSAAAGLVALTGAGDALPAPAHDVRARPATTTPQATLTAREIEVLGMLAEGLGNKTIARRLGISDHTVKFHVASIMAKLNAASRTEAVTLGARQGLILL